jgi:hypothetical protein
MQRLEDTRKGKERKEKIERLRTIGTQSFLNSKHFSNSLYLLTYFTCLL